MRAKNLNFDYIVKLTLKIMIVDILIQIDRIEQERLVELFTHELNCSEVYSCKSCDELLIKKNSKNKLKSKF